jgi:hypothetical protein
MLKMQLDQIRYAVRLLANGWAVRDLVTKTPAAINGMWQVSLSQSNANDLANELNHTMARSNRR